MAAKVGGGAIAIDGLAETIRGLKKIRPELGRRVSKFNRDRVRETILPPAQQNWASQRIKPSLAASAVKPKGTQGVAGITVKYGSQPVAGGVTFGAKQFRQFRPWVGNQHTGGSFGDYIVGPAFDEHGAEFADGLLDDLTDALVRAIS